MSSKIIDAICVSSLKKSRMQIRFHEGTGLIEAVGDLGVPKKQVDFFFDDDCWLFAGMGDVHIHAREDVSGKNTYKEDFLSAQEAMHNGGVTHAGDMPNNPVPPIDDQSYAEKFHLAHKAQGDLWLYAGIGPKTSPLSYAVPYKVYMGPSVGELFFEDLKTLEATLERYRGEWVSFHCEDPEILRLKSHEHTHGERRPPEAEAVATRDALRLIEKYELKGKLCHYSTQEGLKLIREARLRKVNVSLEVTPQHLFFDQDHLPEEDEIFFQMNPPIRKNNDRLSMLEALKQGEIQYLATDHAPHTKEEKARGMSGLTGLDTYGAFVTWLIQEGLDPQLLARVCSENPGDFYNHFLPSWKKLSPLFERFGKGVGYIAQGYRANFTILNLKKKLTLTPQHLKTKVGHSPFLGYEFPGQVEAVFIGGQKV